jgi:hypothetical protein
MALMNRKGIATWISQVIIGLLAIGCVAFLFYLFIGRYFDIHSIIVSNEAQRHAINMAQVLMSSDKLVTEDVFADGTKRYHRGVFDSSKLDVQFATSKADAGKASMVSEEIYYPNIGAQVVVSDMISKKNWALSIGGSGLDNVGQFLGCLRDHIDVFGWAFNPARGPWSSWDTMECFDTYGTKVGVFERDFPVLIYDSASGQYHPGRLYVRLMEM